MRTNELEIGTWLITTEGRGEKGRAAVLALDATLHRPGRIDQELGDQIPTPPSQQGFKTGEVHGREDQLS